MVKVNEVKSAKQSAFLYINIAKNYEAILL